MMVHFRQRKKRVTRAVCVYTGRMVHVRTHTTDDEEGATTKSTNPSPTPKPDPTKHATN